MDALEQEMEKSMKCYEECRVELRDLVVQYDAQQVQIQSHDNLLTVYFGTPSMFITLWFGFDYGTNPPLGTLII
jgi:hypothetical protein